MSADESPLGPLLRKARAATGLTQEELAERAGVSVRTISDVERGLRKTIYRHTVEVLASALDLDDARRAEFEGAAAGSARRGPQGVSAAPFTADVHAAQLPIPPTRLIGRDREVEVVGRALADEEIRLLTLTGPGGIGKTRIALEAARRAEHDRSARVFFVPLSPVVDPGLVGSTVALAIGVTAPLEPLEAAIAERLGDAQALLVLDTFEHLLGAARFVGELLARCRGLKVLVTSREALHLSGEHEVVIPALEMPAHPWRSPAEDATRSAATELFIQRATAARIDFTLDDRSALVMRDICARLDGLPLAIELAAARVKHLSLEALRRKLDDRLSLLTGGPRDLPRRQQTMRDTIAWSYELLAPEEQALFRSLSAFAGGWTLEAATSVWGGPDVAADPLQAMSALVDKSLIFPIDTGGDDDRYSMFDVIREFSVERCEAAGETESARGRHAEYHLDLAEHAEPELGRAEQRAWFRRLEIEHDNFRSALGWFARRGDADRALRLAGALWQFWRRQGYLTEGRMWLRETLSLRPSGADGSRAKALWGAGWLAFAQGDYGEAEALSAELVAVAHKQGAKIDERNALTVLGMILMARGQSDEALEPFQQGLEICLDLGTSWHLATSHLNLGMAHMHAGHLEEAKGLITRAREIYTEIGDQHFEARCVAYLGYVALLAGETARAETLFAASLEHFGELEDLQGIAEGLEGLAAVSAAGKGRGRSVRAGRLAGAASSIRERLTAKQYPFDKAGMEPYLAEARTSLGAAHWEQACQEGREMTLEQAFDLGLRESL
jgi:predicted ATPase/DNA-binding XRE family transcriptional regulator